MRLSVRCVSCGKKSRVIKRSWFEAGVFVCGIDCFVKYCEELVLNGTQQNVER